MKFDSDQQTVVEAKDGVFVCIAGPGSGKTTALIGQFLKRLMDGVTTDQMLYLTFTNAAATEMVKRAGLLNAEKVFRTFHSFAIDLLKKEKENLPFKLKDTVIPVAMEDYKLLFDLTKMYPAIANFRALQDRISGWKKSNIQPDRALAEARDMEYYYALAYRDYEEQCRKQGWLDFDSLMQETVHLLETNPAVRARHQRKYISVDECQDTDIVQFRLLQLIFAGKIFVVGDENQLIYEWRSAQAGNLTNFSRLFPGAKMMYLGRNYRSTKRLVSYFKEILPVDNGLASRMFTENEEGTDPTFVRYSDETQEAERVLAEITDHENTAIIARTNRQLFIYNRLCTMKGIKYKILGKKDFWEQNEVKKLLTLARDSGDSRPAEIVLADTIHKHNLINLYRHSGRAMETNPIENMNNVVKIASGRGNIHEFLDYLRRKTKARRSAKGLTLSTVHQAKGREWNHVYVIGAQQGVMPHKDGEIAEEKRIFFVACSRAAKTLEISFYGNPSELFQNRWGQVKSLVPKEPDGISLRQQ